MTRRGSRLGSIVVMLALSSSAWAAATVTVSGSTGPGSEVGREGSWRPAVEGTAIGETDFLKIPAGASVQVTLRDGKVASFDGKIVVPGRRLVADKTSATNVAWLARAIQNASDAVGGVATAQHAPGATKVENVGSRPESAFQGARADDLDSFDDDAPGGAGGFGTSNASRDEADAKKDERQQNATARPKPPEAEEESSPKKVASSPLPPAPPAPPVQVARSAAASQSQPGADARTSSRAELLAEGLAAESDGNFGAARTSLEKAAAAASGSKKKQEGNVDAMRAEAYLALGRVHLQLGETAAARKALAEAVKLDTAKGQTGPHAARAHYLLGITALERGNRKQADGHFAKLKGHPALESAAQQALSELPR